MMINHQNDKLKAAEWAYGVVASSSLLSSLILDTETTGLGKDAEIVQISLIDMKGNTLLDSLVKPTVLISETATAIHGITNEMVADAYGFDIVYEYLEAILFSKHRDLIIYNADYDLRLISQSLNPYSKGVTKSTKVHCAMKWYSQFVADWNHKRGSYKWQKLPGGDHSALGDCKATLKIIREMATYYTDQLEAPF